MTQPLVIASAEALTNAKVSPNDSRSVVNCILPIAELENHTLEVIVNSMRECHMTVDYMYGIMNRIVKLDPELLVVKDALTPLATAVSALTNCKEIIQVLVKTKLDEVTHLKPYLESTSEISTDGLHQMVDHAHSVDILFQSLHQQLSVALSIAEKLHELSVESAGIASLAYWRGIFEESKSALDTAMQTLDNAVKEHEKAEEPFITLFKMIDTLESHISDESKGLEHLRLMRSSEITHPMKIKEVEEKVAAEIAAREAAQKKAEENRERAESEAELVETATTQLKELKEQQASLSKRKKELNAAIEFKEFKKSMLLKRDEADKVAEMPEATAESAE